MEKFEIAQATAPVGDTFIGAALEMPAAGTSMFALFWQAHPVVQAVMVGLLLASIWSWAIVIDKVLLYARTQREMNKFENAFWSGQSLEELYRSLMHRRNHTLAAIFVAAMREWKRSFESSTNSFVGLQTRIDKVMDVTIARQTERLEGRLLFLATVGSSAPFIGLFGTVWGIMTSFQAIAAARNTSLAVVAPGIAEALFATAMGLFAAIPAVIAYNKFTSTVGRISARMEGFADEFSAILSRQIDDMRSPRRPRPVEQPLQDYRRGASAPASTPAAADRDEDGSSTSSTRVVLPVAKARTA